MPCSVHWFDPKRAVPEIARVLTHGGRLGVLWTSWDRGEDWMAGPDVISPASFGFARTISVDDALDWLATASQVITMCNGGGYGLSWRIGRLAAILAGLWPLSACPEPGFRTVRKQGRHDLGTWPAHSAGKAPRS